MKIILTSCLALGVLVGCGGGGSDTVNEPSEVVLEDTPSSDDSTLVEDNDSTVVEDNSSAVEVVASGPQLPAELVGLWCSESAEAVVGAFLGIESDSTVTTYSTVNSGGCSSTPTAEDLVRIDDWDVMGTTTSEEGLPVFIIQINPLELQGVPLEFLRPNIGLVHVDGDTAFFSDFPSIEDGVTPTMLNLDDPVNRL